MQQNDRGGEGCTHTGTHIHTHMDTDTCARMHAQAQAQAQQRNLLLFERCLEVKQLLPVLRCEFACVLENVQQRAFVPPVGVNNHRLQQPDVSAKAGKGVKNEKAGGEARDCDHSNQHVGGALKATRQVDILVPVCWLQCSQCDRFAPAHRALPTLQSSRVRGRGRCHVRGCVQKANKTKRCAVQ